MNSIGERIIFLRENMDMSQVKLADAIGITKMTLYKYEKNICEPRGEIISRLAVALDTSTDFLLGLTENFSPLNPSGASDCFIRLNEINLITKYRRLNGANRARIEERIDSLLESQDQK